MELSELTNKELKSILRENQVKNYSKLNKKDLVKKVNQLIKLQNGGNSGKRNNRKNGKKKYTLKQLISGGQPPEGTSGVKGEQGEQREQGEQGEQREQEEQEEQGEQGKLKGKSEVKGEQGVQENSPGVQGNLPGVQGNSPGVQGVQGVQKQNEGCEPCTIQ